MLSHVNLLATSVGSQDTVWMPKQASTFAGNVDALFYFILYLSLFFFVLIIAAIVLFSWRYRRRSEDQKTSPVSHSRKLEIVWSVIPAVLLLLLFAWGFRDWMHMSVPPAGALEVRVLGQRWAWSYDYPQQGVSGVNELTVPVNRPVKLIMSSTDVLHSFFVPAFRIKRDVIPGRYTVLWFEATQVGTFDVYCTEYCGAGHSGMFSKVNVVDEAGFKQWTEKAGWDNTIPLAKMGEKIFNGRGCPACHSITADRMAKPGPPLFGKYGSMEKIMGGTQAKFDDDYIRESLNEPNAKVVDGYAPAMPTFQGLLKEREYGALIEYIKSLK